MIENRHDIISCSNIIQHKNLFIEDEFLKEFNIKFTKIEQKENELLILGAGAMHQGYSSSDSISEAINFFIEEEIDIYKKFIACDCEIQSSLELEWILNIDQIEKIILIKKENLNVETQYIEYLEDKIFSFKDRKLERKEIKKTKKRNIKFKNEKNKRNKTSKEEEQKKSNFDIAIESKQKEKLNDSTEENISSEEDTNDSNLDIYKDDIERLEKIIPNLEIKINGIQQYSTIDDIFNDNLEINEKSYFALEFYHSNDYKNYKFKNNSQEKKFYKYLEKGN